MTGDARARLVGKMRQAMIDADAAAPPNDDLGYTALAEFALDALTDDDLADLLGLRKVRCGGFRVVDGVTEAFGDWQWIGPIVRVPDRPSS
jgi:hypothetical protein